MIMQSKCQIVEAEGAWVDKKENKMTIKIVAFENCQFWMRLGGWSKLNEKEAKF